MKALWVLVCVATFLSTGCYATGSATGQHVQRLGSGGSSREILLPDGRMTRLRVRPTSWVRFLLRDGSCSRWFEAKHLRVAKEALIATGCPASKGVDCVPVRIAYMDIAKIEINDLDMGETLVGIVAGTTAVVAAAAIEACLLAALEAITGGHMDSDIGITRAAIVAVVDPIGARPKETPIEQQTHMPTVDDDQLLGARPLFSGQAVRRDWLRAVASVEVGSHEVHPAPATSLAAGLRLWNIFELGGGVSVLSHASSDSGPNRTRVSPFLRMGLHLDLDSRRRVAIPLLVDVGWMEGGNTARFTYGVRIRLTDRLGVGLLPWNPMSLPTMTPDGTASTRMVHMTSLEMNVSF